MGENGVQLFEQGSFHVDPLGMAEAVRQLPSANSGVKASLVVKPTSGLLYGFTVSSIAAQFIQIFDLAALPADTAVPTLVYPVAATSIVGAAWVPVPRAFRNGIVFCNSSTQHTKTIGSADCIFDVQFI